jgi:amidase
VHYLSASDIAAAIAANELTSVAATKHYLARIERYNPQFNAYVQVYTEQALQQAQARDRQTESRGPLHGVPISIKECYLLAGTSTTLNYPPLKNYRGQTTSPLVQRLIDAGAVILGKTNVPQLLADSQTFGPLYPTANNPFDPQRTPGGSTGGGAAALAAGLSSLELGSDIGGSIRNPSSYCGLFGLKPTENGHARDGHVPPLPEQRLGMSVMNCTGPLARSAADLARAYEVLYQPQALAQPLSSLKQLRVGLLSSFHGLQPGKAVQQGLTRMQHVLEQAGAVVTPVQLDQHLAQRIIANWAELFGFSIAQNLSWPIRRLFYWKFRPALRDSSLSVINPLKRGLSLDFKHYSRALYERAELITEVQRSFQPVDVVMSATSMGPAFVHNHTHRRIELDGEAIPYMDYCFPFVALYNLTGQPVLTVPSGLSDNGLPVGISFAGSHHQDALLLNLARLLSEQGVQFSPPQLD